MKRCLSLLLSFLLCLSGCAARTVPAQPDREENQIELTAQTIAAAVAGSQKNAAELAELSGEVLTGYLDSIGLTGWKDAAVLTGRGMSALEITVVRLADGNAAAVAAQCLRDHRKARIGDFFGYAPDQAELLERALVLTSGNYAVFLACSDMAAARTAFAACFESGVSEYVPTPAVTPSPQITPEATPEPAVLNPDLDISGFFPYIQPNEVDMTLYDHSAVVEAWNSGDESGLSDMDRAILVRCRDAFAQVIRDGMSDAEKELALHDWLMANGRYDDLSRDNVAHIGLPNNTDPYGMLVGGYGICLGFASTFQLLMDLAGIECITVIGASYESTADHAWNMVRLDGEWYCVDVTWNNTYEDIGRDDKSTHKYFNVSSDYMREKNHQWDYRNVPEADATRYSWNRIQ